MTTIPVLDAQPNNITNVLCMYDIMVTHIARVWINRVSCQSSTWSAEQEKIIFPCPLSAVPSRVSLLVSILRLNLMLTYGIPPEFRCGVHLFIYNRHTPSGQSRVYRVTLLRADVVHCRVYTGTGPVNIKVVANECCLGRSPWTN